MDDVARSPASRQVYARIAWVLMTLAAVGIALLSAPQYLTFSPDASRLPLNPAFPWHIVVLSLHAIPGGLALLLGPFQFVPAIRSRYPSLHRVIGRVYLACIAFGSAMGIYAAIVSVSGLAAQSGFLLLAAAWFSSGLMAYLAIRRRQIALHRAWMIRNYAFTFAAVLLRVFLGAGLAYRGIDPSIPFPEIYTASVWSSFFVSYVFAEWFIVQRAPGSSMRKPARAGRPTAHARSPATSPETLVLGRASRAMRRGRGGDDREPRDKSPIAPHARAGTTTQELIAPTGPA